MDCRETDERDVISEQTDARVEGFRLIRSCEARTGADEAIRLVVIIVHDTDDILEAVGNFPPDVDEVVALLDEFDGAACAVDVLARPAASADRSEIR